MSVQERAEVAASGLRSPEIEVAAHTPTPWYINIAAGPTQIAAVQPFADIGVCFVPSDARKLNIGEANAAFIVKAVNNHDALVEALRDTLCELTACAQQLAARGLNGHKDDSVSRAQIAARGILAKQFGK